MPRLVMTRKNHQSLIIDVPAGPARRIKLTTLESDGVQSRIAVEADRDVRVLRSELLRENVEPMIAQ